MSIERVRVSGGGGCVRGCFGFTLCDGCGVQNLIHPGAVGDEYGDVYGNFDLVS